jgi:hypothetical protein
MPSENPIRPTELPTPAAPTPAPAMLLFHVVVSCSVAENDKAAHDAFGRAPSFFLEELSAKGKVALGTVKRMEGFDGPVGARTDTLRRIVAVLEKAGVEFLNDDKPGVRLTKVELPKKSGPPKPQRP